MAGKALHRLSPSADPAPRLLGLVKQLAAEARPGLGAEAGLESELERDLGLDSLARVELLGRVEREFGVSLPEDTLGRVDTPADLLRVLVDAQASQGPRPTAAPREQPPAPQTEAFASKPDRARTLVEVLEWHAAVHPTREHVRFRRSAEGYESLAYGRLLAEARAVAGGLLAGGLRRGQAVAIMLPTGLDFFRSFFGALLAGGVPVPLYPPARLSQIEDHLRRQAGILANCEAPVLVTIDEAKLAARLLQAQVDTLRRVTAVSELQGAAPTAVAPARGDVALLQYTSGSTGAPKGVVLTHDNLLANIHAWSRLLAVRADDVCVSWLPLYHDMGLIGAWLGSLYNACPLVLMSPLAFLARPELWLQAIHEHRGTITAAPNFAFELCLHRIPDTALAGLDLSSWRLALNGAEAVSPATVEAFCTRFAAHGFRRETMKPVYGLAECTVALTMPALAAAPRIDRIERDPFVTAGEAVPVADPDTPAMAFVGCGEPIPGHELRVVDKAGRELPERRVGHVQFRGPSATSGYFRNPEATRGLFRGEGPNAWLDTGDLGYVAEGELFPAGRVKDIIVRGGRNLHPEVLEEAIGRLAGVRKGCVAVFGAADADAGTERLVAVAETRSDDEALRRELVREINGLAVDLLGLPLDDIVLAPPHSVLKTSSGKIRRAATRDRYLAGALGKRDAAAWRQLARLFATAARAQLVRGRRWGAERLYAVYAWVVFALLAVPVWALVAFALPLPSWSWAVCHRGARLLLRLAGIPFTVVGAGHLRRDQGCVVVANHASYLDGLLLVAAIEQPLTFVAKRELAAQQVAGRFLRGLGAEFVERFDVRRSVDDAQRLARIARYGQRLAFFPEGTFTRAAGLRPFYMGAFAAAAQNGLPVVPVAIRGSRTLLRESGWFPRRAALTVTIGAPIEPTGSDWHAARALRDAARARILALCGEPDLAHASRPAPRAGGQGGGEAAAPRTG